MSLGKQPGKQKLDAGDKGLLLPGHPLCQPRSIGGERGREGAGENKTSAFPSDRKWRGRTWWIKSMKAILRFHGQSSSRGERENWTQRFALGRIWVAKKLGVLVLDGDRFERSFPSSRILFLFFPHPPFYTLSPCIFESSPR